LKKIARGIRHRLIPAPGKPGVPASPGDDEFQAGSIREAAMLAPRLNISPLTALGDFNRPQSTGRIIRMGDK
jgi:transketolase N-terminal domain/subunit